MIDEYLALVREAVRLMETSGIALPTSRVAWALSHLPNEGELANGSRVRKHGYGCELALRGRVVDFDFGEDGEIDGIDVWRLIEFARAHPSFYGFATAEALESEFKLSVERGELIRRGSLCYIS